jgi:putative ABC transport system substrate-binding protein
MRRCRVVIGAAALLLLPAHPSAKQAPAKIPRVGILTSGENERAPILEAFREGLRDLGYVEGRNVILEFRFARGDPSRGLQLAAELVALPVDVILLEGVAAPTPWTRAAALRSCPRS